MTIFKITLDIVILIIYKYIKMLLQDYKGKNLSAYRSILDENYALPLYYQLELVIKNFLESEDISPGTAFFSEEEIAEQLGVSRPTVNKSIRNLIKKGYLLRSRGKRSVVNKPNNISLVFLEELLSFGEMLKKSNQNFSYKTILIDRKVIKPTHKITKVLNLMENEDVVFLKRLRYVNQEPIIIVDSYLPYNKYFKLLEIPKKEFNKDLYSLIKELFNISVHRSSREVTAVQMTLEDAALLNVEIWESCLRLFAIAYDENEEPFEYFDSRFKGNNCILRSSLLRK